MSRGGDYYNDDERDHGRRGDYDDDFRRRPDIPNYLAPAILCTIFCCLIGGIIAIVNAAQVNSKLAAGDIAGARRASDQAKMWCWISFGVWLGVTPLVIYLRVVAMNAPGGFR